MIRAGKGPAIYTERPRRSDCPRYSFPANQTATQRARAVCRPGKSYVIAFGRLTMTSSRLRRAALLKCMSNGAFSNGKHAARRTKETNMSDELEASPSRSDASSLSKFGSESQHVTCHGSPLHLERKRRCNASGLSIPDLGVSP